MGRGERRGPLAEDFNPLPPRGGRLVVTPPFAPAIHFNPLPPRGGRHAQFSSDLPAAIISTHSLLAEGDAKRFGCANHEDISTHSLLAEGDPRDVLEQLHALAISTHSLLAEGDWDSDTPPWDDGISTHSLLAEGDRKA